MPYKDPEKRKAYHKAYNRVHNKKYYQEHLEEKKVYYKEHLEEKKAYDKKRYQEHSEEVKINSQKYGLPHKRIYTNGGGIWICYKCHATREDDVQLHIHHKDQDPSNNTFSNLVCLCTKCHLSGVHSRWNNETIPKLIRMGIVDWEGNIL